ncbi:siderophore iron transporter [Exophiala viscosa]|uniref:Siderophore iron transporter n=1 Tax=Exophiala viscosa TaxID=2486360 RepID=A0AAN6E7V3_9EURO|nr:siderophore iron transporter [Exophiala viscosa]KAI1627974.1 siderophore iron transporter [Exophiala viscosa]
MSDIVIEGEKESSSTVEHTQGLSKTLTLPDDEAPVARGIDAEEIPAGYWLSFRFLGSVASIVLLAVCLYIGFSLPASCLAVINADLGPSPIYIFITTAGSLISGVGLLLVGRLGDIVGRRYFLIGGQIFGVVAGIISAKATSINMLIGGSVLMGFSTTVQLTFPYVIQELIPNKYRGWAQAGMIVGTLPFSGFSPIIARVLITRTALGWRWCYILYAIFCGLSLILLIFCYFPPNLHQLHRSLTRLEELKQLDYIGIILYGGGILLLLLALAWGGSAYTWTSSHVLATLIVGCLLLVLFGLYETFLPPKQPLLPVRILKNRNYLAVVVAGSVGQMVFVCLSVLWPAEVGSLFTTDNVKIGWISITSGLALAVGEIVIGPVFKAIGHARWQLIFSCVGLTATLGGMAAIDQSKLGAGIALTLLAGFFTGWMELIVLVMNGLVHQPRDLGLANGFLGSVRNTVGVVSVSIYVAILDHRLVVNLPADVSSAAVGAGLPKAEVGSVLAAIANGTAAALEAVPGMTPRIEAAIADGVKTAYSSSFKTVYLASLAFGGLAVVAALFSEDIDHLMTGYVNRRIRGTVATAGITEEDQVPETQTKA